MEGEYLSLDTAKKIAEKDKEIERLKTDKEQLTSLVNSCQEEIRKLKSQLQQKENIIKEVREYIKREDICIDTRKTDGSMDYVDLQQELLEILDKGSDKE